MMLRKIPIAAVIALTALAAGTADAQFDVIRRRGQAVNTSTRGDGRLQIGRSTTRELDRANIVLRQGGRAELRLYRGSTPYVFTGTWDGRRSDVVNLQLDRRDGVRIDANGRVYLGRGDEVQRVEISGQERGQRLRVNFRADGSGGRVTTADPSQTRRGDGRLELGRDTRRDLDRVNVALRRGGAAEVRFYRGSTPYVFTGTWTERGRNTVDLRLTRRDGRSINAMGTLIYRPNGELASIDIDGMESRERLSVSFRAEGSRTGSGVRRGPFDYIDAADEARRHQERRR